MKENYRVVDIYYMDKEFKCSTKDCGEWDGLYPSLEDYFAYCKYCEKLTAKPEKYRKGS